MYYLWWQIICPRDKGPNGVSSVGGLSKGSYSVFMEDYPRLEKKNHGKLQMIRSTGTIGFGPASPVYHLRGWTALKEVSITCTMYIKNFSQSKYCYHLRNNRLNYTILWSPSVIRWKLYITKGKQFLGLIVVLWYTPQCKISIVNVKE